MATVRWQDWNGHGLEHCELVEHAGGLSLEGVVAGTRNGLYGGHYHVRTDAGFRTREVRVVYVQGCRLHVESDGFGRWHDVIRGRPIPDLDGCMDVDIGMTPSTNALPIRRLCLREQESQNITAAYVPLPGQIEADFLPRPARQRYTCLKLGKTYRYEGIFRNFIADLEIDRNGVVLDYPDTFRRIGR